MNDWSPLHEEAMSAFIEASNENDTYEYIEREFVTCEIGLDRPMNTFHVKRGATAAELAEELQMLREVCGKYDQSSDFYEEHEKNDGTRAYEAEMEKFVKAPESEIYLIFHEDCEPINPPLVLKYYHKGKEYIKTIGTEWNVLANWSDLHPECKEVWDRRKVPFAQACERIKQMTALPRKAKEPFKINPQYKANIDQLLAKLVDVDLENGPYKLVAEQLALKNELMQRYALLAAQKFRYLANGRTYFGTGIGYGEHPYMLFLSQCQYDNWNGWYDLFKQHCKIDEWTAKSYESFPIAYWDVSSDPDFAQSEQKVYPIKLSYYNSHESGY